MTLTRYRQSSLIKGGRAIGTNTARVKLYNAVQSNEISSTVYITKQGDRLDRLAGEFYGDGTLWWVIAAASGIGWFLQIPAGVVLAIPTDINEVNRAVS